MFTNKLEAKDYIQNRDKDNEHELVTKLYNQLWLLLHRGGMYADTKGQYLLVEAIERLLQIHLVGVVDDDKHIYKHLFKENN